MCNYTVYSLVDQQEEQQVNNPQKSNFSLPYTNQSLSVHSLPKAQTLANSSLEQLPTHPRWSQLACTESRPTLLFSSLNTFRKFARLLRNTRILYACDRQGIHGGTFTVFHFGDIYLMTILLT